MKLASLLARASVLNAETPAVLQAVVRELRELFGHEIDFVVERATRHFYTMHAKRRIAINGDVDNLWGETWEIARLWCAPESDNPLNGGDK